MSLCCYNDWVCPERQIPRQTYRIYCFDRVKVITPTYRDHFSQLSYLYFLSLPSQYISLLSPSLLYKTYYCHLSPLYPFISFVHLNPSACLHDVSLHFSLSIPLCFLSYCCSKSWQEQFLLILCPMRCDWYTTVAVRMQCVTKGGEYKKPTWQKTDLWHSPESLQLRERGREY